MDKKMCEAAPAPHHPVLPSAVNATLMASDSSLKSGEETPFQCLLEGGGGASS